MNHDASSVSSDRNNRPDDFGTTWQDLDEHFKPGLISSIQARCATFGLVESGRAYIRSAAAQPSRRTKATQRSMAGTFPSDKMGVTIQFESRTLELPTVTTLEFDDDVLAYFDQPPAVRVSYVRDGRKRSYLQTPDYLAIRFDEPVLIECKPLSKIALRNASDPGFYVLEGTRWVCPALREAARQLGMRHEVWHEESFSPFRLRNLRMLGDYMLRGSEIEGYGDALAAMKQFIDTKARASLDELLETLPDKVCVDHLYAAIARRDIAFDWDAAPVSEHTHCFVYRDDSTLESFKAIARAQTPSRDRLKGAVVDLVPGAMLNWDGVEWICQNVGSTTITISKPGNPGSVQPVPRSVVATLLNQGAMTVSSTAVAETADTVVQDRIARASEHDLQVGNLRHKRIQRHLVPGARAAASRTDRRHVAQYKAAEASYGNGFIGLLPGFSRSGNRQPRLLEAVLKIVVGLVDQEYLKPNNINKKAVFGLIDDACRAKALPPPSYSWLCRFIDRLPAFKVARARKGSKGAYGINAPQSDADNIDKMEPERAFERVHIDHTLIDVETLFGETSEPLGRVWLTVAIDHFSRRILAHYLTYDAPSYRSLLMVLRKCVQRHGRVMEAVCVDGGKEMSSVYWETTCALYNIKIIRRPTAQARFGSQIERFFGTTNTNFFNFLQGNTQLRKNVRQLTAEVDPDAHAVWTLPDLNKALSDYFYEVYDMLEHRTLLTTPRFAFEKSLERHGSRPQTWVLYNELFRITTSPAPAKGEAKVQRDGVRISYLYYTCPELQRHLGKTVKVRYDPFDKSLAWAFANGRWLRLKSRNQELFRSLTEHDVDLAAAEWRKRRSDVEKNRLSEPVLVKFLKEVMGTETLLLARRRAAEERRLREQEAEDGAGFDDGSDGSDGGDGDGDGDDASPRAANAAGKPRPKPAAPAAAPTFADIGADIELAETF